MDVFVSLPLVGVDGSAVSITVVKNPRYFETIRPLSADELISFPSGLSVIESRHEKVLEESVHKYFSSLSVSAVQSAANSAVAGVASKGQVVLVSGTKAITIQGVTTSNLGFSQVVAQGGTSTGVYEYKAVCTANTLTISAIDATGALVNTDTSTVNYFIL